MQNKVRSRDLEAVDRLLEDTVVLRPTGAHLHRMLHRVLRAVHTLVTPGRFIQPNPEHEHTEVAVSGDDLRQTKRDDAWRFSSGPSWRTQSVEV